MPTSVVVEKGSMFGEPPSTKRTRVDKTKKKGIARAFSTRLANVLLGLTHLSVGVVVWTMLDTDSPFQAPEVTYISPTGGTGTTTIDLRYLITGFLLITSLFHFIYALRGFAGRLRYVEYAITASLMTVIIQLLSGETRMDVLVLAFGLMATTMLFGWVEDERIENPGMSNAPFFFGWVPFLFAWAIVIVRFFNTLESAGPGAGAVPGFVYAIIWVELFLFCLFAGVQYWFVVRPNAVFDLERYDGQYNILSVTAKLLLAFLAFFGIRGMESSTTTPPA